MQLQSLTKLPKMDYILSRGRTINRKLCLTKHQVFSSATCLWKSLTTTSLIISKKSAQSLIVRYVIFSFLFWFAKPINLNFVLLRSWEIIKRFPSRWAWSISLTQRLPIEVLLSRTTNHSLVMSHSKRWLSLSTRSWIACSAGNNYLTCRRQISLFRVCQMESMRPKSVLSFKNSAQLGASSSRIPSLKTNWLSTLLHSCRFTALPTSTLKMKSRLLLLLPSTNATQRLRSRLHTTKEAQCQFISFPTIQTCAETPTIVSSSSLS